MKRLVTTLFNVFFKSFKHIKIIFILCWNERYTILLFINIMRIVACQKIHYKKIPTHSYRKLLFLFNVFQALNVFNYFFLLKSQKSLAINTKVSKKKIISFVIY